MDATQIPRTAVHPIAVRPLSPIPSAWLLLIEVHAAWDFHFLITNTTLLTNHLTE